MTNVTKLSIMVKPITWVGLIYDFMIAAFVRIACFLRYISEFTRYASLVNRGNSSYALWAVVKKNTITAMFSSNLIRDYYVLHQCTRWISILAFDAATFVCITKVYFIIFAYLLPIVPGWLRWFNFTERQNFGMLIDIKIHGISF